MEHDEEQQKRKRKSLFAPTKPSIFTPSGDEPSAEPPDLPTDLSSRLDDLKDCGCFGEK